MVSTPLLRLIHPKRLFHRRILAGLRGRFSGNRCFIMGNGPSLNEMNLNLLRNDAVWGLNKCHLLFDRLDWRPRFHVGVDRVVVPDMRTELLAMCQTLPNTLFFLPLFFVETGVFPICSNMILFRDAEPESRRGAEGAFSTDAAARVYKSKTVAIVALQLAAFLGFNPIYLIGCDTNYTVPETAQREGNMVLKSTRDDDPNHFAANYFGKEALWRDPNPDAMLENYVLVAEAAKRSGIRIYNATAGGRLEAFPRINFTSLFPSSQCG